METTLVGTTYCWSLLDLGVVLANFAWPIGNHCGGIVGFSLVIQVFKSCCCASLQSPSDQAHKDLGSLVMSPGPL